MVFGFPEESCLRRWNSVTWGTTRPWFADLAHLVPGRHHARVPAKAYPQSLRDVCETLFMTLMRRPEALE